MFKKQLRLRGLDIYQCLNAITMVTPLVVEGRDDVGGAWWLPTPSTPASSPLQPPPPPPSDASVTDPGTNLDIHFKIYTKRYLQLRSTHKNIDL